ncbi:MAG: thiosulfate sulfurtransferase [Gammaproteobacteria bacterium HGW-Gammaproteobacteria-11]|nr:MAG: thiosulfate sulfurtransferase [Gammaproteobacteria bacterium HGW-Gammaproteobacteria-11]
MSQPALPILIDPLALELPLDPSVFRLVDLSRTEQYLQAHIPGAVHVPPEQTQSPAPRPGLLPDSARLHALFAQLGHHPDLHYVLYDDEGGGWAGRFAWILDSIGHPHYSYIDGGIVAWQQAGLLTEQGQQTVPVSNPTIQINQDASIDLASLTTLLGKPELRIWDARSPAEFSGQKVLAAKAGHIPGAVNFEWTAGMDTQRGLRLRRDLQEQLLALGISPDQQIVTHCQTHHRSGFTYLAAKILGYPKVKAYAGSWSEWGNHPDTPVEL